VKGEAEEATLAEQLGQREGKEGVGGLGLTVGHGTVVAVVKVVVGEADAGVQAVTVTGDGNDAGSGSRQDLVHDEVHEEEVADVVHGEVVLNAVLGEFVGHGHDTGAGADDVDVGDVIPRQDLLGGAADSLLGAEVEQEGTGLDTGRLGLDPVGLLLELVRAAAGENEKTGRGTGNVLDVGGTDAPGGDTSGEDDLALDFVGVDLGELRARRVDVELPDHDGGLLVVREIR
jgi:hypothetical protein